MSVNFEAPGALPCPFCGTTPVMNRVGNDFSRKRSITIKCPNCRAQRTDAALRFGFDWLLDTAIKNWNQRPNESGCEPHA